MLHVHVRRVSEIPAFAKEDNAENDKSSADLDKQRRRSTLHLEHHGHLRRHLDDLARIQAQLYSQGFDRGGRRGVGEGGAQVNIR